MRVCAALLLATACTHHHPVTTLRPTSRTATPDDGRAGPPGPIGGLALGATGLALGAVVGAVIGSHDVYELNSGFVPRVSTTIGPGRAGGGLSWSF